MNFVQLRYFSAVAEHKSFTRAAVALGVAQPAITRQIKLLESELGTALVTRHPRGIELTEAGIALFRRSELLIRGLEQARTEIRDLSGTPSGDLRIGSTPALTRPLIVDPLYRFLKKYPNVGIQLQEGISDQLCNAVLADQLDIAVISAKNPRPYLNSTTLFSEEIWLFGPPEWKKKGRAAVPLEIIATLPLLLARRTQTTREIVETRMAAASLPLNLVVETDSIQTIQELVLRGVGYTVAPYSALAACLKDGLMSGASIKDFMIERALIRRSDRPLSRAMAEFGALLLAKAARFKSGHRSRNRPAL
jgi:LysR family nitrogen assimilation transcriptional regulator